MKRKWTKRDLEAKRLRKRLLKIKAVTRLDPFTIKVLTDLRDNSGVLDFNLILSKLTVDDIAVLTRLVDDLLKVRKMADSYKLQLELHEAINMRIINVIGRK